MSIITNNNAKVSPKQEQSQVRSKLRRRRRRRSVALGVVNILFGGLMFAGLYDHLNELLLRFNFQINENNFVYASWENIPIPINCHVYLYQIENEGAFLGKGRRPMFTQHGPFAFKEFRSKRVLSWSQDKSKVAFNEVVRFEANDEQTAEPMDEPLRTTNMVFMMTLGLIGNVLKEWNIKFLSPLATNMINAAFKFSGEELFETRTPREFILGRNFPMLKMLDTISKPLRQLGIPVPGVPVGTREIKEGRFGVLLLRETNEVGPFEMFTGQANRAQFNAYASAYGKSELDAYPPPCSRLEGASDGAFFGRHIKEGQPLFLYNCDACRTMTLQFVKVTTYHGVRVFEYTFDPRMLSQRVRGNRCYCHRSNRTQCEGIVDASHCYNMAPVALTFPHFYRSEHLLANVAGGLRPVEASHRTRFLIEPTMGIALSALVRMQINVIVEPMPGVTDLANLRGPMVFPILWLEEGAQLEPLPAYGLALGIWFMTYGSYTFLLVSLYGLWQVRTALHSPGK